MARQDTIFKVFRRIIKIQFYFNSGWEKTLFYDTVIFNLVNFRFDFVQIYVQCKANGQKRHSTHTQSDFGKK